MLVSSGCHEIHKEVWSTKSESFDTGEEPWKRRCSENGKNTKTTSSPCALSTFLMKSDERHNKDAVCAQLGM